MGKSQERRVNGQRNGAALPAQGPPRFAGVDLQRGRHSVCFVSVPDPPRGCGCALEGSAVQGPLSLAVPKAPAVLKALSRPHTPSFHGQICRDSFTRTPLSPLPPSEKRNAPGHPALSGRAGIRIHTQGRCSPFMAAGTCLRKSCVPDRGENPKNNLGSWGTCLRCSVPW